MRSIFKKNRSEETETSNNILELIEPVDLCIPIYLNQQVVFDMLAVLDDGFARLSTIKISSGETEVSKSGGSALIGVSNVFALLGVSFSGERGKEKGVQKKAEVSQEKVHTPTSLFVKLKLRLREKQLLRRVKSISDLNEVNSGEFVEFKAILRKNPLVDTIETIKTFMELATLFTEDDSSAHSKGKKGKPQNQNSAIMKQLNGMLTTLTQSSSIELIGELLELPGATSVITARPDYFNPSDLSEIIDGEFHVLGKVTRVIKDESDEPINLLRKTAFGRIDQRLFESLSEAMAGLDNVGVNMPEFVTRIESPALLVVPIAIYT